jgi:hypothetical protein
MSKVFRRPMFRKGGNVGEGIMTGIVDRENYANGPNMFDIAGPRTMDSGAPKAMNQSIDVPDLGTITERNVKALLEQAGPSEAYDPLTSFLLQYGPAAAKQTGGGTFANLIAAAEKPVASLIEAKSKESDFLRSLRTQAAGAAIKERSELEQANIDRIFREKLADKAAQLQEKLSQKQIEATKQESILQHNREMEKISERAQAEAQQKKEVLDYAQKIESSIDQQIINDIPTYMEEYGANKTKAANRSRYENKIRDDIVNQMGQSKLGVDVDFDYYGNEDKNNSVAKRLAKQGYENRIVFNVNDGKTYLVTKDGFEPFNIYTQSKEDLTQVTSPNEQAEEITKKSGIEEVFKPGPTDLDKKIMETIKGTSEKLKKGQEQVTKPFR